MHVVKGEFIFDIQQNKNSGSKANGQTQNIYKSIPPILEEISESEKSVVAEHDRRVSYI